MSDPYLVQWLSQTKRLVDIVELGRGGMGEVYRARDPRIGRDYAIKVMLPDHADANAQARFHNEMRALNDIGKHRGVVQFYFSDETPRCDEVIFMEYLDGGSLAEALSARSCAHQAFSVEETVRILRPIAAALDYMHNEARPAWVHRDVKPANILLRSNPGSLAPAVLSDFGISIEEGQSRLTSTGMIIGTEKYASPESSSAAHRTANSSPGDDNYAFALVAFEMLTLHHLKNTMAPSQWDTNRIVPDLSSGVFAQTLHPSTREYAQQVRAVFDKGLNNVPMNRFRTATQLLDALTAALGPAESAPNVAYPSTAQMPEVGATSASSEAPQNWQRAGLSAPQIPRPVESVQPSSPVVAPVPMSAAPRTPAPKRTVNNNALMITATVLIIAVIALTTWALVS